MYTFLTRNGQTIAFGLGILITIVAVGIILGGVGDFEALGEENAARYDTRIFNFGMLAAGFMCAIAAAAMVAFGIYHLATDPKGAIKGIIGLGAIILIFFVIYSIADPNTQMLAVQAKDGFLVSEGQSKMITGSIATGLILTIGAFLALAVSEILSLFR